MYERKEKKIIINYNASAAVYEHEIRLNVHLAV